MSEKGGPDIYVNVLIFVITIHHQFICFPFPPYMKREILPLDDTTMFVSIIYNINCMIFSLIVLLLYVSIFVTFSNFTAYIIYNYLFICSINRY